MEIQIIVPHAMITSKAVAWSGQAPEFFKASQEAIRQAVQDSSRRTQLKQWLESGTKLALGVEFHLKEKRVHPSDLDSLLSDLLNPLVEGACGPRPAGKPIPQPKDALFWRAEITKVKNNEEKVVIRIRPLES